MTETEVSRLLSGQIDALRADMTRRFDEIDGRLDASDTRFRQMDIDAAQFAGARRALVWIGTAVITAAGAAGSYFMSYLPDLLKWWLSRGS